MGHTIKNCPPSSVALRRNKLLVLTIKVKEKTVWRIIAETSSSTIFYNSIIYMVDHFCYSIIWEVLYFQ